MKHLFTFFSAFLVGSMSFGQVVFQSDLSSWTAGNPDGFATSGVTSLETDSIISSNTLSTAGSQNYGTDMASLVNIESGHKRLGTDPVAVTEGNTYTITVYAQASAGEMRTSYRDVTNSSYANYNQYVDLSSGFVSGGSFSQNVTIPAGSGCTSAEFILSLRNTDQNLGVLFQVGILLDSLDISTASITYTPTAIYDIQSNHTGGTSNLEGNYIETAGVVTAINSGNGYWIQDGTGAYSGIFVADEYNTPSQGDSVTVRGIVAEFFDRTQIESLGYYNVESAPSVIPAATAVTTPQIQTEEEWEGVLIQASNVECTNNNAGFGMWTINTNPGTANDSALVDDDLYAFIATVGNTYDVTGIGDYSFGDRKIQPRDINDINGAGSGITTIYDIQNDNTGGASNYDGLVVTTAGIVTGIFQIGGDQYTFFIQDGDGAWNGIYVYESGAQAQALALGDSVLVTGEVEEFNGLTEIKFVSDITVQNSGNAQPTPSVVTNANAGDEEWEGVLVTLEDGIAGAANTFNEWEINDGSSSNVVKVDDVLLPAPFTPGVGNAYTVTGVRHYSFSENFILPRSMAEIVQTGTAGISDLENDYTIYPNPADNQVIVNASPEALVSIYSATGAVVAEGVSNKTIDVSSLSAGLYQVVITEGETKTIKKLMVK